VLPVPAPAVRFAGHLFSAGFGRLAVLRGAKPLHPKGVLLPALVERHGLADPVGAAWLDDAGTSTAAARLSRSAGLPERWPDVWGLSLRTAPPPDPSPADLLMVTSFAAPVARRLLSLHRRPGAPMSSVMPYVAPDGTRVLLGARIETEGRLPSDLAGLTAALRARPARFTLLAARSNGPWAPYGAVTVGGTAAAPLDAVRDGDGGPDGDLSYDPVLNPLPGLRLPTSLAHLRARGYAGARVGRRADARTLDLRPDASRRPPPTSG
jgi:hypothetical protein